MTSHLPPPPCFAPPLAPAGVVAASAERLRLEARGCEERIRDGAATLEDYERYVACLQELARRGELLP